MSNKVIVLVIVFFSMLVFGMFLFAHLSNSDDSKAGAFFACNVPTNNVCAV